MKMKKEEYLKILAKYPPCKEEVLGEKVWTPSMAAKAIGMKSRNTVLNWARKTVAGEMDMPMFGGRIKGSLVHIPIRRFLDWYCYVGQN
jgi:hypothetical protein